MKTFIPRNKPRSLIISVIAGLTGLFVAIPLLYTGAVLKWESQIGSFLLFACELIFATMWAVFVIGSVKGKYKKIEDKEWSRQIW